MGTVLLTGLEMIRRKALGQCWAALDADVSRTGSEVAGCRTGNLPFRQALDNTGVDLEEIVTSHAGLPWDTGRDDDYVGACKGFGHAIVGWKEARYFLYTAALSVTCARFGNGEFVGRQRPMIKETYSRRRNVRQVRRHARSVDNIVESEFVNEVAGLEEEGQRL